MATRSLVVGGTGPSGVHIVNFLLEAGHDVTVFNSGRHNRPIVTAARLPAFYGIIDDDSSDRRTLSRHLGHLVERGIRLIQLRAHALQPLNRHREWLTALIQDCRDRGVSLLLNAEPELARELASDGVHLNAARLRNDRHDAALLPLAHLGR